MFEVGVARTFHALHQLEAEDPVAGHEHSHDYRAEVVARGEQLDQNAMLVDIDALGAALATCLAELDAADLGTLAAFEGQATTVGDGRGARLDPRPGPACRSARAPCPARDRVRSRLTRGLPSIGR